MSRGTAAGLALASSLSLLAAVSLAPGVRGSPPARKTLERTEDLVVVTGSELPKLKRAHKDLLRAFAVREGRWEPIPLQVDEKTPELAYCWTVGPEPLPKDVDEGAVDDDDEVVFEAAESGDEASPSLEPPAGATARHVVELVDPDQGGRGFVYLFAFESRESAPPRSSRRSVSAVLEPEGGALLRTRAFEVACTGSTGITGRPRHVRFLDAEGRPGPEIVRDAERAHLHASYLFVRIDRENGSLRTALGPQLIDGPVRLVAPLAVEVYLIWGNWISTVRSTVQIHGHTWEHHALVSVPVSLDPDTPSEARVSVEMAPGLRGWTFCNPYNPQPVPLDGRPGRSDRAVDARFPSWNGLFGPEGAIVTRIELDRRLSARGNRASLVDGDPIEVGYTLDVTGLKKTEEATPYELTYVAHFLPGARPGDERAVLASRDRPLRRLLR